MQIVRGKLEGAQKLVLYAPEGFGKTTFASKFEDVVFIDTEGSTKQLDVARLGDTAQSWDEILEAVDYVLSHPDCCKNLAIDTIDWAEQACINKLNAEKNTENILTLDYGKGSLLVVAEFQKLINKLDKLIAKGINIVITAHAAMRKQELPDEMGAFDRWEMKLQSKQVKALVKEWADLLIFGNYKTMVYEDQKTKSKKAQGNKRVMYTEHHPCWDAKNRHGLKAELPFDYSEIAFIFENVKKTQTPKPAAPDPKPERKFEHENTAEGIRAAETKALNVPEELKELMLKYDVVAEDIQFAVGLKSKGMYTSETPIDQYDPEFIQRALIDQWDKMLKIINAEKAEIPFN